MNVLKPAGMTSGDVVFYLRKRLPRGTKIGHGGTLDPDACGVLPVCVGSAVRLFDYIVDKKKIYLGEMTLGVTTTTQDASGDVIRRGNYDGIGKEQITVVLPEFTGRIMQTPPDYSAIKKNGRRLYDIARSGGEIEIESREVYVEDIEYASMSGNGRHLLRITCGKGVYIRTLINDIGDKLGCGAHMSMLIREKAGVFDIDSAHTLEEINEKQIEPLLMPLDYPLSAFKRADIGSEYFRYVRNGNELRREWLTTDALPGDTVRLYMDNDFIGMGEMTDEDSMRFRAMLKRFANEDNTPSE